MGAREGNGMDTREVAEEQLLYDQVDNQPL